uniref:RGS domain-containing protein n=1 Tax=Meloidogyne incognita TaxID=6306 RepID=A0A914N1H8_MELIC
MTSLPSSSTAAPFVPETKNNILQKMDTVLLRILNSAHLKTHKYFRVSVPQAITGQVLVQHIHNAFYASSSPSSSNQPSSSVITAEDVGEAVHFATMLLQYGYIFPVIDVHAQSVKEDGTLYRIQLPYFWPSHAQQADNVEYAIYLSKRLLRNELKHGLDEEEADAYNRSFELLSHMWTFISAQAELQLKALKERKKAEKVVFDTEERAFWRTRRPGHSNMVFEEGLQKLDRKIRRPTISHLHTTIERLRLALKTKPWLKMLKASEIMTNWTEQFAEYDPFLSSPLPSNPWISDDSTLWVLNADNVEVPTERRVKRWGLSVIELVRDPIGRQVLESFLDSEFSSENLRFWMSIQDLKYSANSQIETKAQLILDEYLAAGSPCQVNVDSRTLDETLKCINESHTSRRFAFSLAEEHVFTLMSKDSYPRFLRSPIYKGVLDAAKAKGKKRIFDVIKELSNVSVSTKRTPIQKHHKMSRSSACVDVIEGGGIPITSSLTTQSHQTLNTGTTISPPPGGSGGGGLTTSTISKQISSDSLPIIAASRSPVSSSLNLSPPIITGGGGTTSSTTTNTSDTSGTSNKEGK